MSASISPRRRLSFSRVKLFVFALTALNLLPSIATMLASRRSRPRQRATNCWHTLRMAGPLSRRKSAMVLKSGGQAAREPDQLQVPSALALEATRGLHLVEIPVDVDLEDRCRMVARTAWFLRNDAVEAERREVEGVDERIDHPNGILLADVVVNHFREKRCLCPIRALDEPRHPILPRCACENRTMVRQNGRVLTQPPEFAEVGQALRADDRAGSARSALSATSGRKVVDAYGPEAGVDAFGIGSAPRARSSVS